MLPFDGMPDLDNARLRQYRLERVRAELRRRDIAACILFDPINIRYATGFRKWQLFQMHIPSYYLLVSAEGPVILFGAKSHSLETIDDCRPGAPLAFFNGGPRTAEAASAIVDQVKDFLREHGGGNRRVAVERTAPSVALALTEAGLDLCDATDLVESARLIKSPEEILCINYSIAVAEVGMARMREALRAGMTEIELWSILHQTNIAFGGEWIETRALCAGDHTNPWLQEAGDRIIRPGELVAFDTDMIGPYGYCADISRTYFCGPGKPTSEQRELYKLAYEELHHNMALVKHGVTFRELSEKAYKVREEYLPNRYTCLAHGVGMCDEYPKIYYQADWDDSGYDGILQENMVLCVESYIGRVGGNQGVKLEQQVLVTQTGCEVLSKYPFEDDLLG
jgi:Xaa-Pro aminopeptidase